MAVGKSDRILVGGYNLASAMKNVEVRSTREKLDATSLADTNQIFESGSLAGTARTDGMFDSDTVSADKITDVISEAFESGDQEVVSLGYGFYSPGTPVYMLDGCIADWDLPIVVNQIILTNANWTSNNGLRRGKWLISSEVDEGSTNGTSIDNSAATTNGGLAHVHLDNDAASGVVVLIQHSTNNSVWVDLTESVFGTRSTGGYTFALNPSDTDTIDFNGVTFNFLDTVVDPETDVEIQAALADTMQELADVLNASTDPDVALATYTATSNGITVSYDEPGTNGDAYTLDTANGGNSTRTGATLAGGVDLDTNDHFADSIVVEGTVSRYLRAKVTAYGDDTNLVSVAFAR